MLPRLRKVFAAVRSAWRLLAFARLSVERGGGSFRGGRALSVAAFLAGAAHPRRQKHREMPPPGASAPAFAATVEPVSMQTVYGETHRQRVMERVLKMCCMDCPCFDLMAASIRNSGPEIENRCTDCPCFDLMAASIRKSGPEIGNRCTDCPCFDLCTAAIRKSGPEIRNHFMEIPETSLVAAAIVKLTPSNQESLHESPRNDARGCSDCQFWA